MSPGVGRRPSALVGRHHEIEAMDIALQRLLIGRHGRSSVLLGSARAAGGKARARRSLVLRAELQRRDKKVCCSGASMKPLVPDGEDELGISDGQGAGKVHSVGPEVNAGAVRHHWEQRGPEQLREVNR